MTISDLIVLPAVRSDPELANIDPDSLGLPGWDRVWKMLAADPLLPLGSAIPGLHSLRSVDVERARLRLPQRNILHEAGCRTFGDIATCSTASFERCPSAKPGLLASLAKGLVTFLANRGVQPAGPRDEGMPADPLPAPAATGPGSLVALAAAFVSMPNGAITMARLRGGNEAKPPTRQALGNEAQVTGERIRQREEMGLQWLTEALGPGTRLGPSRDRLRMELGAAYPVESLMRVDGMVEFVGSSNVSRGSDVWKLLLHALGYKQKAGWLVSDPIMAPNARGLASFCPGVNGVFGMKPDVINAIVAAGVRPEVAALWLSAAPDLHMLEGHVVAWPANNCRTRARSVLAVHGEPMTLDDLMREVVHGREATRGERNSVRNIITRVGINQVALREWSIAPYTNLAIETVKWVEQYPGRQPPIEALLDAMASKFGAARASTHTYARSSPFLIIEGGIVRLRDNHEPPAVNAAISPGRDRDVFAADTPGEFIWNVCVDFDVRRGSGRIFPQGLYAELGLVRGEDLMLHCGDHKIPVSWPKTTLSPKVGTLRQLADSVGAVDGDVLVFTIDRDLQMAVDHVPTLAGADDTERFVRAVLLGNDDSEETTELIARRSFVPEGQRHVEMLRHLVESSPSRAARALFRAVGPSPETAGDNPAS